MNIRLHHRRWILPCCIVLCAMAIILGASIWAYLAFHQAMNLSNKTPDQAFRFIFKMPVPIEVYDVKVAGEAGLSGNMWMRFKTHNINKTIHTFKQNHQLSVTGPTNQPESLNGLQSIFDGQQYATDAGWNEALSIKKPKYYKFTTIPEGTGWWGILIVDRKNNTVYAWGGLL